MNGRDRSRGSARQCLSVKSWRDLFPLDTVRLMTPTQTLQLRQTMIVGQTTQGLKPRHFQSSLIYSDKDVPAISVVSERIATITPVLGVAQ